MSPETPGPVTVLNRAAIFVDAGYLAAINLKATEMAKARTMDQIPLPTTSTIYHGSCGRSCIARDVDISRLYC